MGWVRVDDSFYDNDKFYDVTALGVAMFVSALAWSNRNLTDGFLPERAAQIIVNFDGLAFGREDEVASPIFYGDAITELVNAGVLEVVDNGYQIVNYLKFQPSAKSVMAEKEAARERMAQARKKRFGGSSPEQTPNFGESSPEVRITPTPTPTPKVKSETRARALPPDFAPTDEQRQWAATVIRASQIDTETQKFIDHFTATGKAMKDWNAAWRNWIRRSREFDRQAPSDFRPAVVGSKCPEHPRMTEPCATCASERAAGIRKDTA